MGGPGESQFRRRASVMEDLRQMATEQIGVINPWAVAQQQFDLAAEKLGWIRACARCSASLAAS